MTKNTKIILIVMLGLGIIALVAYGLISSKKIEADRVESVDSNIDAHLYDESKDTLPEENEEDDLDGDEAIVEDDDFEVYEEDGGWEEDKPGEVATTTTRDRANRDDDELEELYDNTKPPVKAEPIKEEIKPVKTPEPATAATEGDYLVIAGSFKSKRNARKKVKALEKEGFTGTILQLKNSKLQTVVAGRFATEKEAEALVKEIKASGLKAIVKLEQ